MTLFEVSELSSEGAKDARILCSKTPFGKNMAIKIDAALKTIKSNETLRVILKQLIFKAEGYPAHLKQTFEQRWDKAFVNQPKLE